MRKRNYLRHIYAQIKCDMYLRWLESPEYKELQKKLLSIKTPKIVTMMAAMQFTMPSAGGDVLRIRRPHPDITKAYDEIRRLKKVLRRKGPKMIEVQHNNIKAQIKIQKDIIDNLRINREI